MNHCGGEAAWITTYTGRRFHLLDPDPGAIVIEDIAHALSMICRFNGHIRRFYSVAEHSLNVASQCSPDNKLAGLLHDGSEAYISDIVKPLKDTPEFAFYREVEARVQGAVYSAFGLPHGGIPLEVQLVDYHMAGTEGASLLPVIPEWAYQREALPVEIRCLPPVEAELRFLDAFRRLSN